MNKTVQDMKILFKNGNTTEVPNFMTHQIGGGCLQVVFGNKALILNMDEISGVEIEQYDVEDGVVDVEPKDETDVA